MSPEQLSAMSHTCPMPMLWRETMNHESNQRRDLNLHSDILVAICQCLINLLQMHKESGW